MGRRTEHAVTRDAQNGQSEEGCARVMGRRSTFVIMKDVHTKPGQEGYVLCMGLSALGLPNAALQKDAQTELSTEEFVECMVQRSTLKFVIMKDVQTMLSTEESVKGMVQISEPAV